MVRLSYSRGIEIPEVYYPTGISSFLPHDMHTSTPRSRCILGDSLDYTKVDVSIEILFDSLEPVYRNGGWAVYGVRRNVIL